METLFDLVNFTIQPACLAFDWQLTKPIGALMWCQQRICWSFLNKSMGNLQFLYHCSQAWTRTGSVIRLRSYLVSELITPYSSHLKASAYRKEICLQWVSNIWKSVQGTLRPILTVSEGHLRFNFQ